MLGYIDLSRKRIAYFILLTLFFAYAYLEGMIPFTLFLFFELLFLIRFINVKKYLEEKLLSRYPQYEHLPGWAKWAVVLVFYILVFMAFKWVLMNVLMEGIFGIPVQDELKQWMLETYGIEG
jgi:hypothetical protein